MTRRWGGAVERWREEETVNERGIILWNTRQRMRSGVGGVGGRTEGGSGGSGR